jgi:hypothetical protein
MKTNNPSLQFTIEEPTEETPLDFLFDDEDTSSLSEITDAFNTNDPINTIDAAERAFGAPYALIGDWKWAAKQQ